MNALERFAPLPLQESWDNAGLQLGLTETEVSGALLCLDVNEQIVDEAIRRGCNLIVSHHPLLFRGLKQISDLNDVQRTVMKTIENHIAVISMHTNMDNAQGGVNFKIAEKLGLQNVTFLAPKSRRICDTRGGSSVYPTGENSIPRDVRTVQRTAAAPSQTCRHLWRSRRLPAGRGSSSRCRRLYHRRNALPPVFRLRTADSDLCNRALPE